MPLNQTLRKKSHVLWSISLIQDITPEAQTKSEFSEMADDVIKTDAIESITLCLADNLQRFRLMIQDNLTEEDALEECRKLAKVWHQDNEQTLDKLKETKQLSFITWQEFLDWPEYENTTKAVEQLYKENREFRNDVDGRVCQEFKNIKHDAKLVDPSKQTLLLKRYLFEECAFQKFSASKRFSYELYKTQMNKAMRRIKNNSDFVPPGLMCEVHFTQFNPNAKKNLNNKPQTPNTTAKSSLATTPPNDIENSPVFPSFFSHPKQLGVTKETNGIPVSFDVIHESHIKKASEFIQSALELLPIAERENAIKALIRFTTQEIIPLYYTNNYPAFKSQ